MAYKPLLKNSATTGILLSPAWEAGFWKVVSCAAFAGINAVVRYLEGGAVLVPPMVLPANVILFFQNVFAMLFMIPFVLPFLFKKNSLSLITHYPKWHLLRVLMAVVGVWLWYLTLENMPIAEGVALSFTGPVFTVIGARLLLRESVGPQRLLAILLSILGAFIITRPDIALLRPESHLGWVALLPLASAVVLALNKLLTRQLACLGESPERLTLYLLLGMIPVSGLPAWYEWVTPTISHWPWLILLGLLAVLAHLSFGKAYKLAEVSFLMPFGFSKFLFSTALGYYCFSEFPKSSLWIGMSVIALSILLLGYKISLYSKARRLRSNWFKNKE